MRIFLLYFALGYVTFALLFAASGHLRAPRRFGEIVERHGVLPARLAMPAALLVSLLELVLGLAALALLLRRADVAWAPHLLAAAAVLGIVFVLYIERLLRTAGPETPCGCSPFSGRTTSASRYPALALSLSALAGWAVASSLSMPPPAPIGPMAILPTLWALTLAGSVALVPATVPGRPELEV